MKKGILASLAIIALAAPILLAQGPGSGNPPPIAAILQRRVNLLTTLLGLTSAQ
jgi:hypothetical protein